MLTQTLRSRWLAVLMHAGLWVLLLLAFTGLGGRGPRFSEAGAYAARLRSPIPVERIRTLFEPGTAPQGPNTTNLASAFFTRHFMPPVLPPPTTRKVELTYRGFYQTAEGPKIALLNVGDTLVTGAPGAKAVANLFIADITWQALTLTNPAAQTNLLQLSTKKEVEVPIQ
jgi:hypothetical protein